MFKRLSYSLSKKDPGWPGSFTMDIEAYSQLSKGDIANQSKVTLLNHFGSHMDGPRHFNDEGPRLSEMPLETFIYEKPLLVDIPKSFKEMVKVEDLQVFEDSIKNSDLLMVRSGFSQYRFLQPQEYASEGPGFSSDACRYMMDTFPYLKAVAMDWISLASYSNLEEGVLAHQYLLGKFHDHYICIIEDIKLDELQNNSLKRVISSPLFIEEIDSSPVTVLAETK